MALGSFYDYENGIREGDRDALSFNYDVRPILEGEQGAGTLRCPDCGEAGECDCDIPNCYSNQPTYEKYGCNVTGCIQHSK